MEFPGKSSTIWRDMVTGRATCRIRFLAAKIMLGRLMRLVREQPSPENINEGAERLYTIFANNMCLQVVQDDLRELLTGGGLAETPAEPGVAAAAPPDVTVSRR